MSENFYNSINNLFLNNELIKIFLLILLSVLAGYMLDPVPAIFINIFFKSNIFKFVILSVLGIIISLPLNHNKLVYILISSIFILILFEWLRRL